MLGIRVTGLQAVQRYMKTYDETINAGLAKRNLQAALLMERFWKQYLSGTATRSRLGKRTGLLARSIRTKREGPVAIVGTNVVYASIHETGGKTKAHPIRPRTRKVLKFKVGSETVFARFVNHPGSKIPARPHMEPSLRLARPAIDAVYDGLVDEAISRAKAAERSLRRHDLKLSKLVERAGAKTGREIGL